MIFPYLDNEPILPVGIKDRDNHWYLFYGYLDSGAGFSVFHQDVAKILTIDIFKGKKIFLTVGNGAKIETYIHKVPVRFAGKEFIAEISFSPNLGIGTNILGLKSFFDNFKICFNNRKQQVEITP